MSNLDDFKVEELEQRLEMYGWSVHIEETPDPNDPIVYEDSYRLRYTHTFDW